MDKVLIFLIMMMPVLMASDQPGLQVGDKAVNFDLLDVDGDYVSLSDYDEERGVILIFTCNHCPYAQAWEKRIIDLHHEFAPQGYPVVAINPNDSTVVPTDSYSAMQQRAKEKNYPFVYLLDAEQNVFPAYGATKTPHVYLLENTRDGFMVRYIGAVDNNYKDSKAVTETYLADAVRAVMDGGTPQPATTKAIGCSIKVAKE